MATKKRRPRGEAPEAVDRARAGVRRAIVKLIRLLVEEDPGVAAKAYRALHEMGSAAVLGPFLAALGGKSSLLLRTVILLTLDTFGPEYDAEIALGLNLALRSERDLEVASRMRMLALKKGAGAIGTLVSSATGKSMVTGAKGGPELGAAHD